MKILKVRWSGISICVLGLNSRLNSYKIVNYSLCHPSKKVNIKCQLNALGSLVECTLKSKLKLYLDPTGKLHSAPVVRKHKCNTHLLSNPVDATFPVLHAHPAQHAQLTPACLSHLDQTQESKSALAQSAIFVTVTISYVKPVNRDTKLKPNWKKSTYSRPAADPSEVKYAHRPTIRCKPKRKRPKGMRTTYIDPWLARSRHQKHKTKLIHIKSNL